MENFNTTNEIALNERSIELLQKLSRWIKYLLYAVAAYLIFSILSQFITGIVAGVWFTSFMSVVLGNLVLALFIAYPLLRLYQFTQEVNQAITEKSSILLQRAITRLKSYFKYLGILMIIVLGVYGLILLWALINF